MNNNWLRAGRSIEERRRSLMRQARVSGMGRDPDDSCRHCGEDLWKMHDDKRGWEWRSYLGVAPPPGSELVTSRFCQRLPEESGRTSHAPIPRKPAAIEKWLGQ